VGYGSARPTSLSAATSDSGRVGGFTLALGAERAIVPRVVGIVEATHWEGNTAGSHSTFVTGSAALYPVDGFDGYLRAGLGYGNARVVAPITSGVPGAGSEHTVNGPAYQLGAGYDYRISPRVALGAFVSGTSTFGSHGGQYTSSSGGQVSLISYGATMTVRW
jgi:hypothetical protein